MPKIEERRVLRTYEHLLWMLFPHKNPKKFSPYLIMKRYTVNEYFPLASPIAEWGDIADNKTSDNIGKEIGVVF